MKKALIIIALLIPVANCFAQDKAADSSSGLSDAEIPGLKSNDKVLPRWSVDLNYRTGWIDQNSELVNLKSSYSPNNLSTSKYVDPIFSNGRSNGGDVHLNYFFNKNRTLGVSIGAMYIQHTGNMTLDTLYSDYQETKDFKGRSYRQIIHSNGPVREEVKISNLNIPVLFKFKHQFGRPENPSRFGIAAAIGPVFGIYNQTNANASGNFSYEAVYKLDPSSGVVSGFDSSFQPNGNTGTSLVLTEHNYASSDGKSVYFDSLRRQGYNVGLNKSIFNSEKNADYSAISLGAMVQAGLSYQLSYNVTFHLDGYYMYQSWQSNDDGYRPTSRVIEESGIYYGDYKPLTAGIKKSDYHAYGLSAGFRIFFGEKRDVDGDKIPDAIDNCMLVYGKERFHGCPDSDNDGTPDNEDGCPNAAGPVATGGCPDDDGDGVPNEKDACPNDPGELLNGCPISSLKNYAPVDTTLTRENGTRMPPHQVLETDVLHFAFGRADIQDSVAKILDYAAELLNKEPQVVIYVSGYTDDIGSATNNLFLSYQRAKSAKTYLINKGVPDARIIIGGYGMENPVTPNDSPENRAKNRRIEMKLLLPL